MAPFPAAANRMELKAKSVSDPRAAVAVDVAALRAVPELPNGWLISGLVYDVATGLVEVVVPPTPIHTPYIPGENGKAEILHPPFAQRQDVRRGKYKGLLSVLSRPGYPLSKEAPMSMLNANLWLLLLFHPVTTTALLRPVSAIAKVGVIACLSRELSFAQRPQFDVASVKPNTPNSPFDRTPRRSGDRIIMRGELGPMVAYAYHVEPGYPLEGDLSLPDGLELVRHRRQGGGVADRR